MTADPATLRALLARVEVHLRRNLPEYREYLLNLHPSELALLAALLRAKIAETEHDG